MRPMYAVHRYVEIGQRQYRAGSVITDLDMAGWSMTPADVTAALGVLAAKGQIEAIKDRAPTAVEPPERPPVAALRAEDPPAQ
jgi:hypothetical protein